MKTNSLVGLAMLSTLLLSGCSKPEGQEYFPQPRVGATREYSLDYSAPRLGVHSHWRWLEDQYPKTAWYFPSPFNESKCVETSSLVHALARTAKELKVGKRTSHGLRAYYATARRSELIPDAQIAAEMGDKTGAKIIVDRYGDLPPNWYSSKAGEGRIGWLPETGKPAWSLFEVSEVEDTEPENVIIQFPGKLGG